jgi:hypothetical protein
MTGPSSLGARLAQSAPVTDAAARTMLTVVILGALALVLWLMWRGWQGKARRQRDLPRMIDLREPVDLSQALLPPVPGRYIASTRAGDWLDRIIVHGLGVPSRADMVVLQTGVLWQRQGADDVFVPQASLRSARTDRAIAGTVFEDGGVVVVSWRLGESVVETGFRAESFDQHHQIVDAVRSLVPTASGPPGGPSPLAGDGAEA